MDKYIIISPQKMSTNVGFGKGGILAGMATEGTAHIAGVSHVGWGYEKLDH
jgi:UDP-N-acetylglucosamine enolpyruvyl transferase